MNNDLISLVADLSPELAVESPPGVLPPWWDTVVDLGLTQIGVAEAQGGPGGDLSDLVTVTFALASHGADAPLPEVALAAWATGDTPRDNREVTVVTSSDVRPKARRPVPRVGWPQAVTRLIVTDGERRAWSIERFEATTDDEPFCLLGSLVPADPPNAVTLLQSSDRINNRATLLTAARLSGAIAGAHRVTRQYVRERHQFGRPLIDIPAVASNLARLKKISAECLVAVERAAHDDDWAAIAAARAITSRGAGDAVRIAHQLHGAMGTTHEYGLGAYSRILWGHRDDGTSTASWTARLGASVIAHGEAAVWDLTQPKALA